MCYDAEMKYFKNFSRREWVIFGLSVALVGFGAILLWLTTIPLPNFDQVDNRLISESTKIYDRTGKVLLYDIHKDVKRRVVAFADIAADLKNATVAIEDSEFYQHHGLKPTAMLRALLVDLVSGQLHQGGSTITQQVIKNTLLTKEKTWVRKLKELVLAPKLEKVKTKEEILTIYLNENPYGGNIYGIEEAAQTYFHKKASELTLAESAYLAALPQAPTYYSPYGSNRAALDARKNLVLSRMAELGFITAEAKELAQKTEVSFFPLSDSSIKAPHFVQYIREQLEEKYGAEALLTEGFNVTTTLDWDLQQKAEAVVKKYVATNITNFNAHNAGLIAINPKTGELLTMVGSADYFDTAADGNFNVTLAHRQPGSAFKPFAYAQAFNKGFTPETALFDVPTQFDTNCATNPAKCYTPGNYDDKFRGPLTMREALAQSINIPSIKTLYLAGIPDTIKLAKNMGITTLTDPTRYGLTLVLGGGEVTLLDLTSAYGVFANDGLRQAPFSISTITNPAGEILYTAPPAAPERVLPEQSARLVSDILSDNVARTPLYGPTSALYFGSRPVAAKTGTTNDYRDTWIVGYTPSLAVGAWAGNNDNSAMEKKVAGLIVAPLWRAFMDQALAGQPIERFTPPLPTDPSLPPVYRGFWQGGQSYFIDKLSGKLATADTPPELKEERVEISIHSILYWLGRTNDPQYELWEGPVEQWALGQNLNNLWGPAPAATDDLHTPQNKPTISLISPDPKTSYDANQSLTISVNYRGKFAFGELRAFLNDTYLGTANQAPFQISFVPREAGAVVGGNNTLRLVAYDLVRNQTELTSPLLIK
jgi:1A family penicillin-binding protein